ncbi:Sulfatase [Hexamita inflata]|uniref:Sulfatase n=1 Tax=Hexamita inflata TaxID=28002 RepID=A0AA86NBQ6_9EUKA|nr:Sulfatase [Hexamita inflata]
MFQNRVVASKDKIVDGPLYKDMYLPNLRKISENALTFSSLSSSGLPTLYGWLSLMTGEIPYSNQINIVQSMLNDVDDFPSYFQQNGYDTMYVAPCKFDFDGQHIWLFRGKEVRNKKHPQLKEMPLWFDNVYQYIPTQEQAKDLNVTQNYLQSWVPDRITAAQFMKHFDENKKQEECALNDFVRMCINQQYIKYHLQFRSSYRLKRILPYFVFFEILSSSIFSFLQSFQQSWSSSSLILMISFLVSSSSVIQHILQFKKKIWLTSCYQVIICNFIPLFI